MAATVTIEEYHGPTATPVPTDKTAGTIRFKDADDASVNLSDPLVIPTAGTNISFEKIVRMRAAGTFTQLSNLNAYTDGANGLGTGVGIQEKTEATYGTPIEPTSTAGFSDIFARTSGTPVDMDGLNTGVITATGPMGDFMAMIMTVASTATQGVTPSETLTFAWDEI